MDDEMITLNNVMSAELAIQREFEYRTKMELLNFQHLSPLKPLVPSQGPPRSQLGLKRKEPTSNSQFFPEHQASSSCLVLTNQPSVLVCHACTLAFATLFHLRQHCESRRHHEKLIDFKKMGRGFSNPLSCDLCKSPGSSVLVIEGHLNGLKHAQSLMAFENKKMARAGQAWLQTTQFNMKKLGGVHADFHLPLPVIRDDVCILFDRDDVCMLFDRDDVCILSSTGMMNFLRKVKIIDNSKMCNILMIVGATLPPSLKLDLAPAITSCSFYFKDNTKPLEYCIKLDAIKFYHFSTRNKMFVEELALREYLVAVPSTAVLQLSCRLPLGEDAIHHKGFVFGAEKENSSISRELPCRSTFKRMCRDHGITRWKYSKRRMGRHSSSNHSTVNDEELIMNSSLKVIPPLLDTTVVALPQTSQDMNKVNVKATYKRTVIRFETA
ncbi:hypothetical protein POM88_046515 [Heracleum sosnowskyi]|uniref:C2H2-type domain-containing protein n=1 Tax=Heracleum sosnowskyi TaxID=360622 RepID=A0AAD8M637_9APIA|nr:hypothetical protein POM88_046515 [Heracleum sosnowskyi]